MKNNDLGLRATLWEWRGRTTAKEAGRRAVEMMSESEQTQNKRSASQSGLGSLQRRKSRGEVPDAILPRHGVINFRSCVEGLEARWRLIKALDCYALIPSKPIVRRPSRFFIRHCAPTTTRTTSLLPPSFPLPRLSRSRYSTPPPRLALRVSAVEQSSRWDDRPSLIDNQGGDLNAALRVRQFTGRRSPKKGIPLPTIS